MTQQVNDKVLGSRFWVANDFQPLQQNDNASNVAVAPRRQHPANVNSLPISLDKFVIEISSKASMPKLKGSEFRIDEADKDDLNDEFKEISSELMSALSESGLLNSIKDLF